ncbi:hypothetical protein ACYOEI_24805 [Singulisphaera rosea]
MQGRSRMAALALAVGTATALVCSASAAEKPVGYKVHVILKVAGLTPGGRGCDVEIKPAHDGCEFRPETRHVTSTGEQELVLENVRTDSLDRECAFKITIREPGQPERTVRRGLRLPEPKNAAAGASLTCYLNSPSRIAKVAAEQSSVRR